MNYRKHISPNPDRLVPEEQFRLFAVCVRPPEKFASNAQLVPVQPGVYDVPYFDTSLRLIVANQLPQTENNAMLHLFSYREDLLRYGGAHYRPYSPDTSSFLHQLFARYAQEFNMPFTYEQGVQEAVQEILDGMPVEKMLKVVPEKKYLEALPAEKRLEGIPAEKRVEGLSAQELLAAMSPEVREQLKQMARTETPPRSAPPKPEGEGS